jgi:hypothetical protein
MATVNGKSGATGVTSDGAAEEKAALDQCHTNPVTVSSLSSMDTTAHDYNDASVINTNDSYQNIQQSSINTHHQPSVSSTSVSGVEDHSLGLSQTVSQSVPTWSRLEPQQQKVQQLLPSHVASSLGPLMGQATMRLSPTVRVVLPATSAVNSVPEFLCSLTKMLSDNNRDCIEWSNGK